MSPLIHDDFTHLSAPERLALIGELWDSLTDADVPTSPAQMAEIERRLASFEEDRAEASNWADFKADLASRHSS